MVEMRGIALDTNAAIALLNGISSIQDTLRNYDIVFLPATVVGELLFGAKNSQSLVHNVPLMSFDKHFLEIPQLSLITAIEE
jgi:predicted nucleic acid-binding protein